ncbi:MAG: choice-of-anchor J domain-containing protein, partial [Alloprevotella sp.]|nr:choice-of-anchor J domain-containing protein [Alloprevotella sp.]
EINTTTGRAYQVGEDSDVYFIAIAFSPAGELFAMDSDGTIWRVDKATFEAQDELITGVMPVPASLQGLDFDAASGLLYWTGFSADRGFFASYTFDGSDVSYKRIGSLQNDAQVLGLYMDDTPTARTAPAAPVNLTVQPGDNGQQFARLHWTNPTTDLDGNPLAGSLTLKIYRNGVFVTALSSQEAGREVTWTDREASGLTDYTVVAANASGDGRTAWAETVYVGTDTPGPVTGLYASKATAGYDINITWNPPVTGAHGGWFDAGQLTYSVVRQPGAHLLATGLTATSYTDNTITESGGYYYEVTPSTAAGAGTTAHSRTVISGPAQELPYACDFSTDEQVYLWTVVNADRDAYEFGLSYNYGDRNYSYMRYFPGDILNPERAVSDWLMSPAFRLSAGKTYRFTYSVRLQGALYPVSYDLTFGEGVNPEDQTQVFSSVVLDDQGGTFEFVSHEATFSVSEDGIYNIGFHAKNAVSVHVTDLRLEELAATDLAAVSLDGPDAVAVGEAASFTVGVENRGSQPVSSYTLQLLSEDGTELAALTQTATLAVGEQRAETITWTPAGTGTYSLYARVVTDGDADETNNATTTHALIVEDGGTWVDIQDGTSRSRGTPFYLMEKCSRSQTIYTADLFGTTTGLLSAVTYNYRSMVQRTVSPFRAKVYAAVTGQDAFTREAFVPEAGFTKVFEGDIELTEPEGRLTIHFDEPFPYNGGNLCLMLDQAGDASGVYIEWFTRYRGSDTDMHSAYYGGNTPYTGATGQNVLVSQERPNASFYFYTPTGIERVDVAQPAASVTYDLQGRRVSNPAKGLYIVDGKKILMK